MGDDMYQCRLKVIFAEKKLQDPSFNQNKFAKAVGIASNTLSGIVNGKMPTFENALRIAETLEMSVHDIWIKWLGKDEEEQGE